MKVKNLYLDTEGTGLCAKAGNAANGGHPLEQTNCIVNIAGIIEIDGKAKDKFNIFCQPTNWDAVTQEALDINGLTLKQLRSFDTPDVAYQKLTKIFGKYVDKFDKKDKFNMIGWNTSYDLDMLINFFLKQNDKFLGSWINFKTQIDVWKIATYLLVYKGIKWNGSKIECADFKQQTVADALEIVNKGTHTAYNDVLTVYKILKKLDAINDKGLPF